MKSHEAKITPELLSHVYETLPTDGGLDYYDLREKVGRAQRTVRHAVTELVKQRRVEAIRGGLRNRKLFRRVEIPAADRCVRGE